MNWAEVFQTRSNWIEKYGSTMGKRMAILRNLIAMTLLAAAGFLMLEFVTPSGTPVWVYFFVLIGSIFSLLLLGQGKSKSATLIFLSCLNFVLFIEMSSESIRTGFHLHFITLGFGTVLLLGKEEKRLALLFALASVILYLAAFLKLSPVLPYRAYSEDWVKGFFVTNVLLFVVMDWYLIGLVMKLNYKSEIALAESNEKAQEQNQLLVDTNEQLDYFVYRSTNDLRAPLNSILGLISLVEKDPSCSEYFERIKEQVALMERFIREIIDVSSNARKPIANEPIKLREKVEYIVSSMNYIGHFNQVHVALDVDSNLIVFSDRARLGVILANLVSNAIQFADLGKALPLVNVVAKELEEGVEIKISDNGIGVAPEYQGKIFDMFYRASDRSKGTGLGLFVADETARKLNSNLAFSSTVGKGSVFWFQLPKATQDSIVHG